VRISVSIFFSAGMMLTSCGVAHKAAVTSYHVATAPVRIVARQFEDRPPENAAATTDVYVPGHPIAAASPKTKAKPQTTTTSTRPSNQPTTAKSKSGAPVRGPSPSADFPVAKPVPGKSGYVFSPFDSSKYVDVSGYAPGSKVKDPYAQRIFIVP
jgi:hypothetical protein